MKSLLRFFRYKTIIFLLSVGLTACNAVKYIPQDDSLLNAVRVKGVDKEYKNDIHSLTPKVNSTLLGMRVSLFTYNVFNARHGAYKKKPISFGKAPRLYDSLVAVQSAKYIHQYLFNKGYFNNEVTITIDTLKKQKIALVYHVEQRDPYCVRSMSFDIPDSALYRLYKADYKQPIATGSQYDYYLLEAEVSRATTLFQNNGYKTFERSFVKFRADTIRSDSTIIVDGQRAYEVDLTTVILPPKGHTDFTVYAMNNTYITIDASSKRYAKKAVDTLESIHHVYFVNNQSNFNPKTLAQLIIFDQDKIYKQEDFIATYTRLSDLNLFKFITFSFRPSPEDSTKLNTFIELIPMKKHTMTVEGEITLSGSYWGTTGKLGFSNRDIFGGGAILTTQLMGALSFQPTNFNGLQQARIREKTFNLVNTLTFPRLLAPFEVNPRYSLPKTIITLGYLNETQLQFQTGNVYTSITYDWKETKSKRHYLTPVSMAFNKSELDSALRSKYMKDGNYAALERYSSYFSLGMGYTFTFNEYKLKQGGTFWYFKGLVNTTGNLLYGLYSIPKPSKNSNGQYVMGEIPFYQYVLPDVEIRKYIKINKMQLVTRFHTGLGIAYGNSSTMPYNMLYGSSASTNRAWRSQQVGPGAFPRNDIYPVTPTDSLQLSLYQLGEMIIEANIELRFPLARNFLGMKIHGAGFVDAANVWNISNIFSDLYPGGDFTFNTFYKQLAIGTGIGVRFDISVMVLRFDIGLKLHDPQFEDPKNQWVIKHWGDKNFKQKYPDFRFVNYVIGIGYPF